MVRQESSRLLKEGNQGKGAGRTVQLLNRKTANVRDRDSLCEDGCQTGTGRARIPQTWAGKAAEEKLLYIPSASCASPSQSGFLCFVSPYFVPREAAEDKTQSEKWKLWDGLSETGCLK